MLSDKKTNEIPMTVVRKTRVKIIKMQLEPPVQEDAKKSNQPPFPPVTRFNTGYFKGRDNDVL